MLPPVQPLLPTRHLLSRHSIIQISPFLLSCFLPQQHRAASILSSLSDNQGAYNKKIRRGRGPASGKGKTSGRGHKGQKQHGKVPRGFNGGQTKEEDTNPIRGLNNGTVFSVDMTALNLDRLQTWITQGRIDPSRPITIKELGDSRCINPTNIGDGIKLLARGSQKISTQLNIVVSRASTAAIAAVEAAGGSVTTRYYTPFSIKRILQGKTDPVNSLQSRSVNLPLFLSRPTLKSAGEKVRPEELAEKMKVVWQNRLPDPVSRKAIEYYRDPAHRGYLSYHVQQGQGPSLFFKSPKAAGVHLPRKSSKSKKATASNNRIW